MSLIKNLVKEPEKKPSKPRKGKKDGDAGSDGDEKDDKKPVGPFLKTATDLQRLKLEKLMKNPDKPVVIPEARREKDFMATVPSFVRNVMGSSAGAGSGEFHVYRHLRRKEYARQKNIQAKSAREEADEVYQQKLEDNRRTAEDKTAKKRAKRLKKKQRAKRPREQKPAEEENQASESSDDASDEEPMEVAASADQQPIEQTSNESEAEPATLKADGAAEKPAADIEDKPDEVDSAPSTSEQTVASQPVELAEEPAVDTEDKPDEVVPEASQPAEEAKSDDTETKKKSD